MWSVVYEKAIRDDGSLLFPERLSHAKLLEIRKTQGSYIFANQYQNEIIPEGSQPFKKEWLKPYEKLPEKLYHFAFIDPAISQSDGADFTACVVVAVDEDQQWYVRSVLRGHMTPTEIVNMVFRLQKSWACQCIGIEDVAYQKALLYMLDEEMRRRGMILPIKGIKPSTEQSKEMRIMGLIPRFEWGRILLAPGLNDLELELAQFPKGKHDDVIDALAYIEQIAFYPDKKKVDPNKEPSPNDPTYESWYIRKLVKERSRSQED